MFSKIRKQRYFKKSSIKNRQSSIETVFVMKIKVIIAVFFLYGALASARDRGSDIEFYGYKGIDIEALRKALPVHEGDKYSAEIDQQILRAVKRATGHEPTYVVAMSCDEQGDNVLFIGLAAGERERCAYNPEPQGMPQQSTNIN